MAIMFPGTPMERVHRFVCQQIWYYWHLHIKTILAYSNENTSSIPQPSNSESHCSVVLEVISGNVLSNLTVTTQYRNVFYSTCTPFFKKKKNVYFFFINLLMAKMGQTLQFSIYFYFCLCCPFRPVFSDVLQRSQKLLWSRGYVGLYLDLFCRL